MLWGGRFKEQLNSNALKFSSSLSTDINLILEDIQGSKAHAAMLAAVNIISNEESEKIINGLTAVEEEWQKGTWLPDENVFEDIHSAIESRLYELIGDTAGKLHTGRSRNDQVAADIRLWIKKAVRKLSEAIINLQKTLVEISSVHVNTIIPGYTHLQRAQPISLAFHLLAYVEMLENDKSRVNFVQNFVNVSPLGSGALAGSTLPLDLNLTSSLLGFALPASNSLYAVSERDFILDFINACSIGMMHLSRLSEELILWSTSEWNFIKIGDQFTTGSSLMPQKKNPDMAELIRGKTGRVYGNYISLATTMKALPLSYNRDMQEDKEPLFDSFFTYIDSLDIMNEMLKSSAFNESGFSRQLDGDFSLATDLADWLVLKGVPFREAHKIVGEVVKKLEEAGTNFKGATIKLLKGINPIFDVTALECFYIENSLKKKKTLSSPNPQFVENRIKYWEKILQ